MIDYMNTATCDPLELVEQCLALACAGIAMDNAAIKESLQLILHEKISALFNALYEEEPPAPALP
ncbi:hypothetical protein SOASR030_32280 [Leminorella grimontii]|uniref:DUF4089 domain-containing protein n=1 Tax=Leminorella grimontii TaxID=82981 RepID=A0AAV5N4T8_9GAMM|nr:hypothetical protein [Leminorella grimontii]KFC92623.1 hypothetical protein GLGR_3732 [Leminorella grimontii ATCC 33999 = DSM 5078]GKX57116.1 hypothetical protein SOASR030_32280 [Leminorella grimontii]VFS62571.1 Uncharacterised protein [Leminorella grimontii]